MPWFPGQYLGLSLPRATCGGKRLVRAMNHRGTRSSSVGGFQQTTFVKRNLSPPAGANAIFSSEEDLLRWRWPSLSNKGDGSLWSQQSQGRYSRNNYRSLHTGSRRGSQQSTSNSESSRTPQHSLLAPWVLTWLHEGCRDCILFNSDLQDHAPGVLLRIKCRS